MKLFCPSFCFPVLSSDQTNKWSWMGKIFSLCFLKWLLSQTHFTFSKHPFLQGTVKDFHCLSAPCSLQTSALVFKLHSLNLIWREITNIFMYINERKGKSIYFLPPDEEEKGLVFIASELSQRGGFVFPSSPCVTWVITNCCPHGRRAGDDSM